MKAGAVSLTGGGVVALAGLALLVLGGAFLYLRYGDALAKFASVKLNPSNPDNMVNTAVSAAVSSSLGRETSLGGEIADLVFKITHPGFDIRDPVSVPAQGAMASG